jgi:hypothetical protein
VVGDGYIVSSTEVIADTVRATSFNGVPTGIVPRIYVASLSQVGVADPTATVLNNSFGEIVWTRVAAGDYVGDILDYDNGTILITEITVMANNVNYDGIISATYNFSSNQIFITTTKIGIGLSDGYLVESTIEIKYYI